MYVKGDMQAIQRKKGEGKRRGRGRQMVKTKVTLDTNLIISALGWEGNPKQIFEKIADGKIELIVSITN